MKIKTLTLEGGLTKRHLKTLRTLVNEAKEVVEEHLESMHSFAEDGYFEDIPNNLEDYKDEVEQGICDGYDDDDLNFALISIEIDLQAPAAWKKLKEAQKDAPEVQYIR